MNVIFLGPLALSVVIAVYFLISDEVGNVGKLFAIGLVGTSIVLQFGGSGVHFLVPLGMQLVVCIWFAFLRQLNS